ncbi:initiator tRNA phosphoribosyl transferase-domain-containing protein [Chytridium lagenaria]|nr:initiator tRNA phosphoribosyl transferase-domain-containing protein [Chytridium lagenaria]
MSLLHQQREEIRKDTRNILNRLRSIDHDATFISQISRHLPHLPLIANERCGSWYINPTQAYPQSVYFKSTDGHYNNWDFNMRRLNRHILDVIAVHEGGFHTPWKKTPDSLAKTIPIWCATINTAIDMHAKKKLGYESSYPPFICFTNRARTSNLIFPYSPKNPFVLTGWVLLCARVGDDHEAWGMGLDPVSFWNNRERLMEVASAEECEAIVKKLVKEKEGDVETEGDGKESFSWIGETGIAIGNRKSGDPTTCWSHFNAVVNCGAPEYPTHTAAKNYLYLPIPEGKKGQHAFYEHIPTALAFIMTHLQNKDKVLIHCMQGKDRSVAIALCVLVNGMGSDGVFDLERPVQKGSIGVYPGFQTCCAAV